MITRQHRPSRIARFALPVIAAFFVGYFAYHGVEGDLGLVGTRHLVGREEQLQDELNRLTAERHALEAKVAKMRGPEIDEDVLDERARAILDFTRPNEVVLRSQSQLDRSINQISANSVN